jgi:two-component system, NtrC family, sensor kinase
MFPFSTNSIRFRLLVAFSLLTLCISVIFGALHVAHEIRSFRQRTGEKAAILAESLAGSSRVPLFADNREELLQRARESADHRGGQQVLIFNSTGTIVARADHDPGLPSGELIMRQVPVTTAPPTAISGEAGDAGTGPAYLGKVRLTMNSAELEDFKKTLYLTSTLTVLFFWVIVSYLSYWAVRWVTRALAPLIDGLKIIRAGEYSTRIDLKNGGELAEAADAVSELAESLQRREAENQRLQQELVAAMRLEVREERTKIMAQLLQTNRMTSLGLMVAGMAHEINTPNAAIRLAGQQVAMTWRDLIPILDRLVEEEGDFILGGVEYHLLRDRLPEAADIIVRSADKINQVVKDLRNYNLGKQRDPTDQVDVTRVVQEALAIVRAQGSRGLVRLAPKLEQGLPLVRGDRYQLEQVMTNLLLNGMQAIPAESPGTVTVSTGQDETSGEVTMTVRDDGEGISPELLPHLLEPFFSTRIEQGGSGLGLYITNYIVTEHCGRLTITSQPGQGTTVTVSLPAANKENL